MATSTLATAAGSNLLPTCLSICSITTAVAASTVGAGADSTDAAAAAAAFAAGAPD